MASSTQQKGGAHALVFPFPIPGHINPLTSFSFALASPSPTSTTITVSLLHTQANLHRLPPSLPPNIRLLDIPDGLPVDFDRASNHQAFFFSIQQMQPAFEQLLQQLLGSSPVSCIISDVFFPWVQNVANKFDIPLFLFVADAAAVFSISLHTRRLIADGFLGDGCPKDRDSTELIDFIPGIPPFHPDYLPFPKPEFGEFVFKLRISLYDRINEAAGVLLNTFYELERDAIDGARAHLSIPIFPVGPLLPNSLCPPDLTWNTEPSLSDDPSSTQWLDAQAPSSVVYVAFGTLAKLTEAQIQVIADGLKDSDQPFLWALKSQTNTLPKDFLTQTKGRGLVVSWAPQLKVLAHPAVGAFMTHCGWNSVIESVNEGVPMLCWPQFLDQLMNCRLIVDQWKVGVELQTGQEGRSVERLIRLLLLEGEGKALKKRASELRDAAKQAVCAAPRGSSLENWQAFRELLTAISTKVEH